MVQTDVDLWTQVDDEDLWVFDKAIVSKRLGYICGPKGVPVPKPDNYIIRPTMNLLGMGRGAYFAYLSGSTEVAIPDGSFWCEVFRGRHLSVDYHWGEQILCVEGVRDDMANLNRWAKWFKVSDKIALPKILEPFKDKYEYINVELIGTNIIEIHLRPNPDFFGHSCEYIIPSYDRIDMANHKFVVASESERIGYFIPEE
jgi:hypothetical protein